MFLTADPVGELGPSPQLVASSDLFDLEGPLLLIVAFV